MTRENERFNQKLAIQSEALAGFMLYVMRVTPQLPQEIFTRMRALFSQKKN